MAAFLRIFTGFPGAPVLPNMKIHVDTNRLLYSRQAAALSLGLSSRTIDRLISSGVLAVRKIGHRIMITAPSLKCVWQLGLPWPTSRFVLAHPSDRANS